MDCGVAMKTKTTKELPILFSGPMVRAILEWRKTQTRRVVTPHNSYRQVSLNAWPFDLSRAWSDPGFPQLYGGRKAEYLHVPFCHPGEGWEKDARYDTLERWYCRWQPGDKLWVKETWQTTDETINESPGVVYRATDHGWESMEGWRWRPSIFMPRWASRLTLEITDVRAQRVQDISESDAESEGVTLKPIDHRPGWAYRTAFEELWDSINAARGYGWQANPWVWVISFRVIKD